MTTQCLICDKQLKREGEFIFDCGIVDVSFGYGSRNDPIGIYDSKDSKKDKLLLCDRIQAYICDDCFDRKIDYFEGYQLEKQKVKRVV